jgi:hypothetical protein
MDRGVHVVCRFVRCKHPGHHVDPADWDLGHLPDRSGWTGPEVPACNRATARHRPTSRVPR